MRGKSVPGVPVLILLRRSQVPRLHAVRRDVMSAAKRRQRGRLSKSHTTMDAIPLHIQACSCSHSDSDGRPCCRPRKVDRSLSWRSRLGTCLLDPVIPVSANAGRDISTIVRRCSHIDTHDARMTSSVSRSSVKRTTAPSASPRSRATSASHSMASGTGRGEAASVLPSAWAAAKGSMADTDASSGMSRTR